MMTQQQLAHFYRKLYQQLNDIGDISTQENFNAFKERTLDTVGNDFLLSTASSDSLEHVFNIFTASHAGVRLRPKPAQGNTSTPSTNPMAMPFESEETQEKNSAMNADSFQNVPVAAAMATAVPVTNADPSVIEVEATPFVTVNVEARPVQPTTGDTYNTFNTYNIHVDEDNYYSNRCHHYHNNRYSNDNSDFWFWMWWFEFNNRNHHSQGYSSISSQPSRSSQQSEADRKAAEKQQAILLLGFAVLVLGAATYATAHHVASQLQDSFERLYYNEGRALALMGLFSVTTTGSVGAYLAGLPMQQWLLGLALTAGAPHALAVGIGIFGLISCAVVSSFVGMAAAQYLQKLYINNQSYTQDSLSSLDPERFRLTDAEALHLSSKGYDPKVVECAIVEMVIQMQNQAEESDANKKISMYTPSLFTKQTQYQRDKIQLIRGMRAGDENALNKVINLGDGDAHMAKFNFLADESNPQSFAYMTRPSAPGFGGM